MKLNHATITHRDDKKHEVEATVALQPNQRRMNGWVVYHPFLIFLCYFLWIKPKKVKGNEPKDIREKL